MSRSFFASYNFKLNLWCFKHHKIMYSGVKRKISNLIIHGRRQIVSWLCANFKFSVKALPCWKSLITVINQLITLHLTFHGESRPTWFFCVSSLMAVSSLKLYESVQVFYVNLSVFDYFVRLMSLTCLRLPPIFLF